AELGQHQVPADLARAQHALGVLGRPGDVVERGHALDQAVGAWLAALVVEQVEQLVEVLDHEDLPAQQPLPASIEAEAAPPDGGRPGPRDRIGDGGGVSDWEAAHLRPGVRAGRDQLAIDDDRYAGYAIGGASGAGRRLDRHGGPPVDGVDQV